MWLPPRHPKMNVGKDVLNQKNHLLQVSQSNSYDNWENIEETST
jgi:hypothetical protein